MYVVDGYEGLRACGVRLHAQVLRLIDNEECFWYALHRYPFRLTGQGICGILPQGLTPSVRAAQSRSDAVYNSLWTWFSVLYCLMLTRLAVPNSANKDHMERLAYLYQAYPVFLSIPPF